MPVETASFVSDLNASNPAHSDGLNQADSHMRLIKATLKASFAHTGQLTNTDNQLIPADGSSTKPAYAFASEPTLGFYRSAAGIISITGGKLKGGVPVGAVFMFPVEPASLGKASADTGKDYLELNGATYNVADYPDLANFLGIPQGTTTFTVPAMTDTGRFPRSRTATVTAGTKQASQNKTHTHAVSGSTGNESNDHSHGFSGSTSFMDRNQSHTHTAVLSWAATSTGGGSFGCGGFPTQGSVDSTNTDHTHSFSGNTGGRSAAHHHDFSTTSAAGSADGDEARPESISFVFCIKT